MRPPLVQYSVGIPLRVHRLLTPEDDRYAHSNLHLEDSGWLSTPRSSLRLGEGGEGKLGTLQPSDRPLTNHEVLSGIRSW